MTKYTPLLTQVRLQYLDVDCGMSYTVRLEDGRFLVIDGGMGEYEEPEKLLELMQRQSCGMHPSVAMWFFSHPHNDHTGGFTALLGRHPDALTVECAAFDFASDERSFGASDMTDFYRVLDANPAIRRMKPVRGDVYRWGSVAVRVLFTQSDMPEDGFYCNDASLILRLECGERSVLLPGDAMQKETEQMCLVTAPEYVKCEVLQVPHHGYHGGGEVFFRAADPEYLLWPCPDYRFIEVERYEYNRFLAESPKIRRVLCGGRREDEFDLSDPACFAKARKIPAESELVLLPGEGRVADMGICSVVGGHTGFFPILFTQEGGCLCMEHITAGPCCPPADGDRFSVLEFVQPGRMTLENGFTLNVEADISAETKKFGVEADSVFPVELPEDRVLWLEKRGAVTFTVRGDCGGRKLMLACDDECACLEMHNGGRHGLYLAFMGGSVRIRSIRVTAGR